MLRLLQQLALWAGRTWLLLLVQHGRSRQRGCLGNNCRGRDGLLLLLLLVLLMQLVRRLLQLLGMLLVGLIVQRLVRIAEHRVDGIDFAKLLKERDQFAQFAVGHIVEPGFYRNLFTENK